MDPTRKAGKEDRLWGEALEEPDDLTNFTVTAEDVSELTVTDYQSIFREESVDATLLNSDPSIASAGGDRYGIIRLIGRGGMGAVYLVRDRNLNRVLAMKVIRVSDRSRGSIPLTAIEQKLERRFVKEAEITGKLDHPGVVPVHEIGRDGEGRIFFTMKLVKGQSLEEVLNSLPTHSMKSFPHFLVNVFIRICETLAFAHQRGVIHRDLKPANIMVGEFGEVYVMDWGIAKLLAEGVEAGDLSNEVAKKVPSEYETEESDLGQTMPGTVLGTPAYMSPEQAAGKIDEIDQRSDIYSVGAILYKALVGFHPFRDIIDKDPKRKLHQLVTTSTPTSIDSINRKVPAELTAICAKAMDRDKGMRYESMQSFAQDFRSFMENRVVLAHQTGALIELRKWFLRNRWAASMATLAMFIAVAGSMSLALIRHQATIDLTKERNATADALILEQKAKAETIRQRNQIKSLYLVEKAKQVKEEDPVLGGLLSVQAHEVDPSSESRKIMLQILPLINELHTLRCEDAEIWCASYDPNFSEIAVGLDDGSVRVWDPDTGNLDHLFLGHTRPVRDVRYSPDGHWLASCSYDASVRVWDMQQNRLFRVLNAEIGEMSLSRWSSGSDQLLACSVHGNVASWSIPDGKLLYQDHSHADRVWAMSQDASSSMIALGSLQGSISVLNFKTGDQIWWKQAHTEGISSLDLSVGSKMLVSTSGEESSKSIPDGIDVSETLDPDELHIWDAMNGRHVRAIGPLDSRPVVARFLPNGKSIICGDQRGFIYVWNPFSGELNLKFRAHEGRIRVLEVSSDGSQVLSADSKGGKLWNIEDSSLLMGQLNGHSMEIISGQMQDDFNRGFTIDSSSVKTWDAASLATENNPDADPNTAVVFVQDGQRFFSVDATHTRIVGRSIPSLEIVSSSPVTEDIGFFDVSTDGTLMGTVVGGQRIQLSSTRTGAQIWERNFTAPIFRFYFSEDDRRLVVYYKDMNRWDVLDVRTAKTVSENALDDSKIVQIGPESVNILTLQEQPSTYAVLNVLDGTKLISGAHPDGTLKYGFFSDSGTYIALWKYALESSLDFFHLESQKIIYKHVVNGKDMGPFNLDFCRQKDLAAFILNRSSIYVVDLNKQSTIAVIENQSDNLMSLELSPTGNRLLVHPRSGASFLWDLDLSRRLTIVSEPGDPIFMSRFSDDGKYLLVSHRESGKVVLWNLESGDVHCELAENLNPTNMWFLPDQQNILINSKSGRFATIPIHPETSLASRLPRSFSKAEIAYYQLQSLNAEIESREALVFDLGELISLCVSEIRNQNQEKELYVSKLNQLLIQWMPLCLQLTESDNRSFVQAIISEMEFVKSEIHPELRMQIENIYTTQE